MFIQQGKTNWISIIIVALIAGVVSGGLVVYINDTVRQTTVLSQIAELKKPEKTQNIQTTENTTQPICGNSACETGETAANCFKDCGETPTVKTAKDTSNITSVKSGFPCGGWSQGGRVVCDCDGRLEKSTCPVGTMCDGGYDVCYGTCGNCRCDGGNGSDRPCKGSDIFFTDICSRKLSENPSEEQKTACTKSGGTMQCANGSCRCSCQCAQEGEYTKVSGGYRECCAGLEKIKTQFEVNVGPDGECKQQPDAPLEVYICAKCGDGICGKGEVKCNCPADCSSDCAKAGEPVFFSRDLGPTKCCSANSGIKPSNGPQDGGCTAISTLSPVGVCAEGWQKTCGDGQCGPGENKCNCSQDCKN